MAAQNVSNVSNAVTDSSIDAMFSNEVSPQWGEGAPRGGKTVLGRILKDGAKVPLFLGQTLVNSLRDLGYNSTTSALCEHVDNALQWGATEIRVYFHQTGKRGEFKTAVLVYDNGKGMAPHVLKVATAFGGSMVYDNRGGIGRYGMGMKAAALSMSPVLEVYSWQERNEIYSMTLDVEDIGSNKSNLIELSEPILNEKLPSEIVDILTKPMVYPKNPSETQTLFAENLDELQDRFPNSGTIVFMPECDRLSFKIAQSLADHATKEMGRIYRRFIAKGIKLFVNNRLVEAFDPTYSMPSARHTRIEGIPVLYSKLIRSWPIEVPISENCATTTTVKVRLFALPYDQWSDLPRKVLKNDLHVFDDHTVSFVRNDREIEIGSSYPKLKLRRHSDLTWFRLEIDFSGEADEGAGVAANKQGVRLKEYFAEKIVEKIGDEIATLREVIKEMQAKRAARRSGSKVSEAERRATDAEAFQGKPLPQISEAEQAALDQNLRALAVTLKHDGETDDQAFERVKASTYLTVFKHDEYWPFYHCDYKFGKVILTVNTAHPFFQRIWQPLSELSNTAEIAQESGEDNVEIGPGVAEKCREALLGIQAMLFSLARTQSQLSTDDVENERKQIFEKLRREWSENLTTQLNAK
jgi:histidine kinase/DNA gyrase B/HSP90-like ATPase